MMFEKEDLLGIIKDVNMALVEINSNDFDTPLKKLGIDSLDMVNILLVIEEKYNIGVPDEDINKLNTINIMYNYLNEKMREH